MPGARLHAAIRPERGHRRRIARLADQPRDVIGLGLDELHVAHRRADVLGRDVTAAERLTCRPCARKIGSRLRILLSPMMTALPPPRFSPATAALYVMPRASRRQSINASRSVE